LKKNLTAMTVLASLMSLTALATLLLAGGATATVRSVKTYVIPIGSWATVAGTGVYCKATDSTTHVPSFSCSLFQQTGSHLSARGDRYGTLVNANGVVVYKTNAAAVKYTFTKTYVNG
jgi:hypothetical protein